MGNSLPFVALWSEVSTLGDVVLHILTREAHHTVPLPEIGANSKAVEEFLPDMVRAMPSPDPQTRWLLLLEPSLPETWLRLCWEALNLTGRSLSSQALVVRSAAWSHQQASTGKDAFFLDLFPPEEFSFGNRLQPLIQSGILRTCRSAFLKEQMTAARDLFIMAHGRAHGLVDAAGNIFDLPIAPQMPERIWLLACNVDGAMDNLAQHLLDQGCRTVIAATSDLSAPEMARLVEDLFANGHALDENISWLARAETASSRGGGSHSLTIWGNASIDRSPCAKWNRLTWDSEHGAWCRPPLDDETKREEFLGAYEQAMSPQAWPITRKWMLPPLLWLAEKHHHPAMKQLSIQIGDSKSPEAIRSLAAAARRVGNYIQMAKYLSLGLNIPDLPVKERAEYLGALANLFIDLDLPESAAAAIELHEDCNLDDPKDRDEAEFRRLDWMARTEARRGRLHIALDLMTTKRKRAESDSGRELAWQLYLSTWGHIAGQVPVDVAASLADEVAERLASATPQEVGYGNETIAYLLRALAVYAWAVNDLALLDILSKWLQFSLERLTEDDPGPWAYVIAYLHLQGAASQQDFDRAMSALERTHYYLEAAVFFGFANQNTKCQKLLAHFHRRRVDTISHLIPSKYLSMKTVEAELQARNYLQDFHDSGNRTSAARLGIMPL